MSTDDLLTGGDVSRLLGISRQRLSQLRDGEGFPRPLRKMGSAHVWRWQDIQAWLETRRGERPEVHPALERRAHQLERLGYRVSVTRDEGQMHVGGGLPQGGSGKWSAWISMRGNMSVGSTNEHDDPSAALADALSQFEHLADRQFTDRDIEARTQELIFRRGWREEHSGGMLLDSSGEWAVYQLNPPDGGEPIKCKAESPLEARRQAVERAEARQAQVDGGSG